MNKLKPIIIIIYIILTKYSIVGQDVQFSQLFADRLYLNPSYAGTDYCPRVSLSYRNQWPGVQFPYQTYSVSYDQYSEVLKGGLGVRIMKDDQGGIFKQLSADFIYAHHVKFKTNSSLSLAFQASVYQRSVNVSDLIFADMIDPRYGVIYSNTENINIQPLLSPDFSAAILYKFKNYFAGINISHIPQNIVQDHNIYLPMKMIVHAGAALPIFKGDPKNPVYVFEPNIVYVRQQSLNMLYYGMYFDVSQVALGAFIRQDLKMHFDAVILSFHMDVKQMKIGYSYDLTLSRFFKHSWGTHELSLVYLFNCRKKIKDYGTISCPDF